MSVADLIPLFGMACLAWTAHEGLGLLRAARVETVARDAARAPAEGPASGRPVRPRATRPRRKRYACWDESGRRIPVEDATVRGRAGAGAP